MIYTTVKIYVDSVHFQDAIYFVINTDRIQYPVKNIVYDHLRQPVHMLLVYLAVFPIFHFFHNLMRVFAIAALPSLLLQTHLPQ